MLLSCIASLLALASTVVHGTRLAALASNHPSHVLFERGPEGNPPSLTILGLQKLNKVLILFRAKRLFSSEGHLRDSRWPKHSKTYAENQEAFTTVIWSIYPSMKGHLETIYHPILEPGFYTSAGQPIGPEGEGALVNLLEAEIARALLMRETIARQSRNMVQIGELTSTIKNLLWSWFRQSESIIKPSAERRNAYNDLRESCDRDRFVFYYNDEEPKANEQARTDAEIQAQAAECLKPGVYGPGTPIEAFLKYLDKELRSMVRTTNPLSLDEGLHVDELRAPQSNEVFGSDRYAKYHEIFMAICNRHRGVLHRGRLPMYTYDPDTRSPGPGRIYILEAELIRNCALWEIRPANDDTVDPVVEVRSLLAGANLLEALVMAINTGAILKVNEHWLCPFVRSSRLRDIIPLLEEAWSACVLKGTGRELEAEVNRVLT